MQISRFFIWLVVQTAWICRKTTAVSFSPFCPFLLPPSPDMTKRNPHHSPLISFQPNYIKIASDHLLKTLTSFESTKCNFLSHAPIRPPSLSSPSQNPTNQRLRMPNSGARVSKNPSSRSLQNPRIQGGFWSAEERRIGFWEGFCPDFRGSAGEAGGRRRQCGRLRCDRHRIRDRRAGCGDAAGGERG